MFADEEEGEGPREGGVRGRRSRLSNRDTDGDFGLKRYGEVCELERGTVLGK